jgi:hypothetical protein
VSHDHMQVEEEVTEFVRSGSRSARRASELQCSRDIHSVCWANAMLARQLLWGEYYLGSGGQKLNLQLAVRH